MLPKEELIRRFRALGIDDMAEITQLHELRGDFINLTYTLPGGQTVQLWDDDKMYYGTEVCRIGSDRCYGLVADERYLLVCEYGSGGSDAEIVVFQKL